MASRLNPTTFGYQNFYSSTLSGDITSGTLSIGLSTVPSPTAGILVIEPDSSTNREVVLYTSKGASTVTAPSDGRGYSGSTATSHLQGSTVIMAPVDKWFTALASGELSTDPLRTELFFDYIASGCVWTADAAGSTRNASMTSGVVYIAGRRLTVAAITAHTFTASKDTYVDFSDNGDGTALVTYNEVTNNSASPALSTNNLRNAIIVTGATTIATAGSVNQGQESAVLPIASSVPYAVTDSLGNLICPRDPNHRILGYKQVLTNFTATTSANVTITGLSPTVIVPTGRKILVTVFNPAFFNIGTTGGNITMVLWDGAVGGTQIQQSSAALSNSAGAANTLAWEGTPTSSTKTFNVSISGNTNVTATFSTSPNQPGFIRVELA